MAQGRAWAQIGSAQPLPKPPGGTSYKKPHPASPSNWAEEKQLCDLPVKSKGERQGWNHLPTEKMVPLPTNYVGACSLAHLLEQEMLEELGSLSAPGPEEEVDFRGTLQVKQAAALSLFSHLAHNS